jgi:hypothetical protein
MMLFVRKRLERFDSFLIDKEDFPWFDFPDKLGSDEVKSAGLRGNYRCILKLSEDGGTSIKL